MVTPAHRKGGLESSSNCLWLLLIPLVSLLFSYCSITLAFPLILGCTELTYMAACFLTATCPALQSSATPDILSRPSTSSSLGLSSLGNFLLLCRMYVFVYMLSLHQLDEQQVESRTAFVLFSAICVSFSLPGLSRAFRQRCPTQVGGWVLGQSLRLDSMKMMLLLGDMDVSYSMWPS